MLQNFQSLHAQALEVIRRSPWLIGSAAQAYCPGGFDNLRCRSGLFKRFNGTRSGNYDRPTGTELLFETFSQRYERASTLVTSNLPFEEWTEIFGSVRLTGALLDRLTHHVHILEMNGDSYRLKQSRRKRTSPPDR